MENLNPSRGTFDCRPNRGETTTLTDFAGEVLDEIANGLIVCDGESRLQSANRSALEELHSESALRLVGRTIRLSHGPACLLDRAIADAALRGRRCLLTLQSDDPPMLAVVPLKTAQPGPAPVLLMIGRRGICSPLGLDMLGLAYRLSCAERRVLGALMANTPPLKIASLHGVALSTVRSQIKAVRAKLGVDNIQGLCVRAAQVPQVAVAWSRYTSGRLRHGGAENETVQRETSATATVA